jgi:hypothetical protein
MKPLLLSLFLFIWINGFGQFNRLIGTWITPQQDCMVIHDTINEYDNSNRLCSVTGDEGMALLVYGDTLSFQKRYFSSATNYEKLYVDRYDLKVIMFNDTIMKVKPVSNLSRKFFTNRKVLTFKLQSFAIDKSIRLEKIIFHTTKCLGDCPVYHLQINNSGQVKLHAEVVYSSGMEYEKNTAEGYFAGQLNDTTFKKLIRKIQTCNLQTLKVNNALCCDGSIQTIIVYFNGKRKYIKTMFPPAITDELISVLYGICEKGGFKRITTRFKIEE